MLPAEKLAAATKMKAGWTTLPAATKNKSSLRSSRVTLTAGVLSMPLLAFPLAAILEEAKKI